MSANVIYHLRDASQWRHLKTEHDAFFLAVKDEVSTIMMKFLP